MENETALLSHQTKTFNLIEHDYFSTLWKYIPLTLIAVATMLANASLAVLTVLANSLERSTEPGLELFISECNQIRNIYYPRCRGPSMSGTTINVYVGNFGLNSFTYLY